MIKKGFAFFCCLTLALSSVFASAGQQSSGGASGKPEISATMLDRGWVPAVEGSYEDNRWTRWINDNSPARVKWVPVLRTESGQRINALFAAGNAPDIVIEYGKAFMDNLYNQGVIQPVADHIENYSIQYKEYLSQHPELRPYMIAEDGQQYGMTSARNIWSTANDAIFIRKDWLDKFGMSAPKTLEELVTYLRRVRDEDPDGNGVKDTLGLGFNSLYLSIIRTTFGAPASDFGVENGHYVDWTSSGGYRDYLAFLASLYKEGLIDPEYITDTQSTRQRQLLITGKAGLWLDAFSTQMMNDILELKKNVPAADLITIDPWRTNRGQFDLTLATPDYYMLCMNKSAKDPKAIMSYLDWLISDGWWTLTFGLEGRHYRLVNGIPQNIDAELNGIEISYLQEYTPVTQYQITPEWFPIRATQDANGQMWAQMQSAFYGARMDDNPLRYVPYTPTSDAIRQHTAELTDRVKSIETSIIMGTISVDEGLRQLTDAKNAAGWAAVNAERDAWYQKNKTLF